MEADSGGVTEAGTTQRDVVREGVVQIGVTFRVLKRWLNKFSAYKKLASITVGYLDTATSNIVTTQMYIDGYQVKLVSDTSYGSLGECPSYCKSSDCKLYSEKNVTLWYNSVTLRSRGTS